MSGAKIIEGLKDAVAGNFSRVTIEGQVWVRRGYEEWQPINTAPRDQFILLFCSEDSSRWFAKWQGDRWYGVDEMGLTREGHSANDPEIVTGWALDLWMPLPVAPAH